MPRSSSALSVDVGTDPRTHMTITSDQENDVHIDQNW